uniref:Immunoglobulin V-set domain-containing protein n=1 Tax=Stegastes partitus TaxID=144197 RepID=A0A3B4Z478_9TELE
MKPLLLCLHHLCFLLILISVVKTLTQPHPQVVKEKTEVEISCSHDDATLQLMYWYQQRKDSPSLILIGYGYDIGQPIYEGQLEEQFQLRRQSTTAGTLLLVNDSSVYYCAASHSDALRAGSHTNNKTDGRKELWFV